MRDKKIYIFRHGQTDWNVQKRCQGHTDIPLNARGIEQAQALGLKLRSIDFDVVYSSDLSRARITAEIVLQGREVPLVVTDRLRETHMGEAEGLTVDEARTRFGSHVWDNFRSNRPEAMLLGFPGGETRGAALARLKGFFDEICADSSVQTIGLSTHGGALRSLLHSFLEEGAAPLAIPNCVVYGLNFCPDLLQWKIKGPL
jgi:2,3-bisphosphoglycerate-dependent phosphoglycerate mutase